MSILTSRFVLPIYLLAIFYYFLKFFFIFTVIFTCLIICSSASAIKIQNTSKFPPRIKHEHLRDGSGTIKPAHHYTNTWVSEIQGESYAVHKILERQGYVILDEIFPNTYHLHHPKVKKRSYAKEEYYSGQLEAHPQVLYVKQQIAKRRAKRDVITLSFPSSKSRNENRTNSRASMEPDAFLHKLFMANPFPKNDPQWRQMWYLNRGSDRDLNVYGAWESGYSGLGIVVSIIDDGLEKNHPDLVANYDPQASYDINSNDDDPSPRYDFANSNKHGTRCAGEVAAVANNHKCGVGVAFRASIGGIRMLDGDVSDAIEARALSFNNQHIDIYSGSWGPDDDGMTVDGPGPLTMRAFTEGITRGRGGKGSIFIWASGNGGREFDNCNCDGYTNSIFTLSVSSATESDKIPWYSESCAATLATTYSGGSTWEAQISTIDLHHECTSNHSGTSASAPLAAGIVALTLEANTELTWRDVQHIVVATARPKPLKALDWKTNGAGRKVSHSFGFGLMDAGAMVQLARRWKNVRPQLKFEDYPYNEMKMIPPEDSKIFKTFISHANRINSLEHVQIRVSLEAKRRGDIKISLVSPNGTRSILLTKRERDHSTEGFPDWTLMTVHCWGESPLGTWKLEISNDGHSYAKLERWGLILYGTEENPIIKNKYVTTKSEKNATIAAKHVNGDRENTNEIAKMPLNFQRLSKNDTKLNTASQNTFSFWAAFLTSLIFIIS